MHKLQYPTPLHIHIHQLFSVLSFCCRFRNARQKSNASMCEIEVWIYLQSLRRFHLNWHIFFSVWQSNFIQVRQEIPFSLSLSLFEGCANIIYYKMQNTWAVSSEQTRNANTNLKLKIFCGLKLPISKHINWHLSKSPSAYPKPEFPNPKNQTRRTHKEGKRNLSRTTTHLSY